MKAGKKKEDEFWVKWRSECNKANGGNTQTKVCFDKVTNLQLCSVDAQNGQIGRTLSLQSKSV